MNINQEQLTIFKTVIETGSFSAAARRLGKVPSAVSMSIANLELDLNLILFERVGREPKPTVQAQQLYEKTNHLLVEINQWKQHAHALSEGLESNLDIVVVSELLHTHWINYIQAIEKEFPTLQINIFSAPQEDAMKMLMNGSVQFALMFERETLDYREEFIELLQESLVPIVNQDHFLAHKPQVTAEDLRQHRQIIVTSRDRDIKPELLFSYDYWRTDHYHIALSLIEKQLGWGLMPLDVLKETPLNFKVLQVEEFNAKFDYLIDLVWSKEKALGLASQFLIRYAKEQRHTKSCVS